MELFRSEHWVITLEEPLHLVRAARTSTPYPDVAALEHSFAQLLSLWANRDRRQLKLLLDLRDGPLRNDDAFEQVMHRYRSSLFGGFAGFAVLVKTAVGKLQLQRVSREDGIAIPVFGEEKAALAHLAGSGRTDAARR